MAQEIREGGFDAVIHAAAVSDYRVERGLHTCTTAVSRDASAGKVKSRRPELWLRLVPAPKLVDRVRTDWGFRGVLVKFKLEVGLSDDECWRSPSIAQHSDADLMVANTLEGMNDWALVGGEAGYAKVPRRGNSIST